MLGLSDPRNWAVTRIKCKHPNTFNLVDVGEGRLACFLKSYLPMDPKQAGMHNYENRNNRYFQMFRKDAGLLDVEDWMAGTIKTVLKPLFSQLFADSLSEETLAALITYLKKPSTLSKYPNDVFLTLGLGAPHQPRIESLMERLTQQNSLTTDHMNLINSAFCALNRVSEYLISHLEAQGLLQTFGPSRLHRPTSAATNKVLSHMPRALDRLFIGEMRRNYRQRARWSRPISRKGIPEPLGKSFHQHVSQLESLDTKFIADAFKHRTQYLFDRTAAIKPIKRIDAQYLQSKHQDVPLVHCNHSGNDLYLLEHHRIWGAQLVGLPIQVDFLPISTLN